MKPHTIQNKSIFNNQDIRKKIIKSRKNSDSEPLNEAIIINTEDGYAEFIISPKLSGDFISRISESNCRKLDDLAMLINGSELSVKPDNAPGIYVFYSTLSDGFAVKENIYNAGYIPELTG